MSAHTPGPWKRYDSLEDSWIGNADTGEIVCDRPHVNYRDDRLDVRWNGNAPLLAAAPTLYAMASRIEDALLRLPTLPPIIGLLDMEQLRAAIAQAEGRKE